MSTALKRCNICYDSCRKKLKPCGHLTHKKCLQEWQNHRPASPPQCPECKTRITFPQLGPARPKIAGHSGIPCPLIDAYTFQCPRCDMYAIRLDGCTSVTCVCGWQFSIPRRIPLLQAWRFYLKYLLGIFLGLVLLYVMWVVFPPDTSDPDPIDPEILAKIRQAEAELKNLRQGLEYREIGRFFSFLFIVVRLISSIAIVFGSLFAIVNVISP